MFFLRALVYPCLYRTEVEVAAVEGDRNSCSATHNKTEFAPKLYKPEDAPWKYSCRDKFGNVAKRRVNTIFDYETAPYSNMVLGEVLNDWVTGQDICRIGILSRRCIILNSIIRRIWGELCGDEVFKSTEGSFLPFLVADCIHRQWLRDFRCIPAG